MCVCVCEYVLYLFLCEYQYVPSIPAHVVCVRMFLYNIQCCVEFVVHCVLSFSKYACWLLPSNQSCNGLIYLGCMKCMAD